MPLFRRSSSKTAGSPTAAPSAAAPRGSGLRAGVDLGGTKIQALVVDSENRVIGTGSDPAVALPGSGLVRGDVVENPLVSHGGAAGSQAVGAR